MADNLPHHEQIKQTANRLVEIYRALPGMHHLDSMFLPSRSRVIEIIEVLRRIIFPGFFDDCRVGLDNVQNRAEMLLAEVRSLLYEESRQALRYQLNQDSGDQVNPGDDCPTCDPEARRVTEEFLQQLPELRALLATDVQAAFDGDPAAKSTDQIIFCYPGLDAIFTYRIAHMLYRMGLPMVPRIMTEYAHNETGIEIHPGAEIEESFFIDHGTGVVIGETTNIGKRVKVYQGVTLGALSTKGGQDWRGLKRHPTIEDDVTIYGGAIILGGETVIGKGATIGGSVFITNSVPAGHMVTMKMPELKMRAPKTDQPIKSDKQDSHE